MSVERIALDIKVAAQELVEALAGKEALPTLAEVQACSNNVSVQHRPIAVPNMYSTCIQPVVMICWHIAARVCMNHSTKHNSSMTHGFTQRSTCLRGHPPGKYHSGSLDWKHH